MTSHKDVTPRTGQYTRYGESEPHWWASNPFGGVEGLGYVSANGKTEEEAIAKWHAAHERHAKKTAVWEADLEEHGSRARALASRRIESTAALTNAYLQPTAVGHEVVVWGHGRYRVGIVTEISKTGKRITVLWFSPADLKQGNRWGKRTTYAAGEVAVRRA